MTLPEPIQKILSAFPQGRAAMDRPLSLRAVRAGAMNQITRVTGHELDWALRVAGEGDQRLLVDRTSEFHAHAAAAEGDLAPTVVYAAPAEGVLVTLWVDANDSATTGLLDTTEGLARLGRRLRQLHELPVPVGLRTVDGFAVAREYLGNPRAGCGPISRQTYLQALRSCALGINSPEMRLCHNDLHSGNVLDNGKLWFLDWEYAGIGDPRFDLAGVVAYHGLPSPKVAALLQGYGRLSPVDLEPWVTLFEVVHGLWLDIAGAWDSLPSERRQRLLTRFP